MEFSSPTLERALPTNEFYEARFEQLLVNFERTCDEYEVPSGWRVASLGILYEVRHAYDGQAPWIACENLEGIPIALKVADTIEEFWGTPVNKPAVICSFAGHDNGKIDLPFDWNQVSHEGLKWPPEYRELGKLHPRYGANRARSYGLPMVVWRPIEESHGKQLSPCYGSCPDLSGEELHVRNCVGIGDCIDAMFDRENTFNQEMPLNERIAYCEAYIRNACGDYKNGGPELAEFIIKRVVPQPQLHVV